MLKLYHTALPNNLKTGPLVLNAYNEWASVLFVCIVVNIIVENLIKRCTIAMIGVDALTFQQIVQW